MPKRKAGQKKRQNQDRVCERPKNATRPSGKRKGKTVAAEPSASRLGSSRRPRSKTSSRLCEGAQTPKTLCAFEFDLHPDLHQPLAEFPGSGTRAPSRSSADSLVILPTTSLEEWLHERGYTKSVRPGYLGLNVDRTAKKVWRVLKRPGSNDFSTARVDFARSPKQWYCFLMIYDSGAKGVLASDLSAGYPSNKKGPYRQAVWDMSIKRLSKLQIKVDEGQGRNRRWRFVDVSRPDQTKSAQKIFFA